MKEYTKFFNEKKRTWGVSIAALIKMQGGMMYGNVCNWTYGHKHTRTFFDGSTTSHEPCNEDNGSNNHQGNGGRMHQGVGCVYAGYMQ